MAHEQPALDDGRPATVCRSRNRGSRPQVARREFSLGLEPRRQNASLDWRQRARRRRRRDLGSKLHAERLARDATHSSGAVALPLGGVRWLAICPNTGWRVAHLYIGRAGALSRHAYRLKFNSQRECPLDRSLRRRDKALAKLKADSPMDLRRAQGNAHSNLWKALARSHQGGRFFRRGSPGAVWIRDLAGRVASNISSNIS